MLTARATWQSLSPLSELHRPDDEPQPRSFFVVVVVCTEGSRAPAFLRRPTAALFFFFFFLLFFSFFLFFFLPSILSFVSVIVAAASLKCLGAAQPNTCP